MASTERVIVMDDDHMLRMIAALLSPRATGSQQEIAEFLRPEQVRRDQLPALLTRPAGIEVLLAPEPRSGADVLLTRRAPVTAQWITANPGLRLIQRLGAFAGNIDLDAAFRQGVSVSCLPRPSLASVAEHVILLMLALAKRLLVADRAVRSGAASPGPTGAAQVNWATVSGIGGLGGRTLGLVGLGEVGAMVAQRATPFGMRVLCTDHSACAARRAAEVGAQACTLEQLLAEADFVSIHVQGSPQNAGLFDARLFAAMKPGAMLINTSRGSVIDEDALLAALRSGRLAGAGLDVHRGEPRAADDPLCALDSVVLTPHTAGGSRCLVLEEAGRVLENIDAALRGEGPPHGRVGRG
jgi:phosphoglycerate dehydrogenase-like enzyme